MRTLHPTEQRRAFQLQLQRAWLQTPPPSSRREMAAGEMAAGEMAAGEMAAGEMREIAAGEIRS